MRYWYAALRPDARGLRTTRDDAGNPDPGWAVEIKKESYFTIKKNREDELIEYDEFGLPVTPDQDDLGLPA